MSSFNTKSCCILLLAAALLLCEGAVALRGEAIRQRGPPDEGDRAHRMAAVPYYSTSSSSSSWRPQAGSR